MTEPRRYWAIESPDGEFSDIAESEEMCWHYATQSGVVSQFESNNSDRSCQAR